MNRKMILRMPLLIITAPIEIVAAFASCILILIVMFADLLPDQCWYRGGKFHKED